MGRRGRRVRAGRRREERGWNPPSPVSLGRYLIIDKDI